MARCVGFFALAVIAALVTGCSGCGGHGGMPDGSVPPDGTVDGSRDGGGVDADMATPDGGMPDLGAVITICPGDALPSTASGRCDVTAGSANILVTADVLAPGEVLRGGQVLVDGTTGAITCAACDCSGMPGATGATTVVCPDGVISPGLINTHDHITYTQDLPYTDTGERYEQRHDWRTGRRGHTRIPSMGSASGDEINWGELRFVLSGATSTNGSGSADGFLRNLDKTANEGLPEPPVDYDTFPLGDTSGTQLATGCGYPMMNTTAAIAADNAYTPHISEGIDATARNEFTCLSMGANDLVQPQTAVIHGAGLLPSDYQLMAARGATLIWSPRSNITLYGDTARVTVAARLGVRIALGTDWMPTGSMNETRELQCADSFNSTYLDHFFSDEQLWLMATRDAAYAMGVDMELGTIDPGKVADLAIFDARTHHDWRAVIDAQPQDVMLVLRSGRVLSGDQALVEQMPMGGTSCDMLDVCGTPKRVCTMREVGKTLDFLMTMNAASYPLFFCPPLTHPDMEPSCTPMRPTSVMGSTVYDGMPTATDSDGDGLPDATDLCPRVFDPIRPLDNGMEADADGDMVGDACDVCPLDVGTACSGPTPGDSDSDGVPDTSDNCPTMPNGDQMDMDGDGHGDVCDACPMSPNPGAAACPATIYQVKNGTVAAGAMVAIAGSIVTGVGSNGFFMQVPDGSPIFAGDDYKGIFVFTGARPTVAAGDMVDVTTAMVMNFHGQLELSGATLVVTSSGAAAPVPVDETAADVVTGGARATQLESVLVRITGPLSITDLAPAPGAGDTAPTHEFAIDAGLRIDDYLYLATPFPVLTDTLASATGILALRTGNSKLEPRLVDDLPFSGTPALTGIDPSPTFTYVGTTDAPTIPAPLTVHVSRAPMSDTFVAIVSGDPTVLTVTGGGVTIPAGMTSAPVLLSGVAQTSDVVLTATLDTTSLMAHVRVLDPAELPTAITLTPPTSSVGTGGTTDLDVNLDIPAPAGGTNVALSATAGATVPAMVTVPAGALSTTFTVVAGTAAATVMVTADLGGVLATATVDVTVGGGTGLVINEVDYDQVGTDNAEFVEIRNAGSGSASLAGLSLVLLNGATNLTYATHDLSALGSVPAGGYLVVCLPAVTPAAGAIVDAVTGFTVQNGSPDGIALVDTASMTVLDALSYEGAMTAAMVTGAGTVSLVHGTVLPTSVADSNTVAGSLCRISSTGNDATDWMFCPTLTPGAANM